MGLSRWKLSEEERMVGMSWHLQRKWSGADAVRCSAALHEAVESINVAGVDAANGLAQRFQLGCCCALRLPYKAPL